MKAKNVDYFEDGIPHRLDKYELLKGTSYRIVRDVAASGVCSSGIPNSTSTLNWNASKGNQAPI